MDFEMKPGLIAGITLLCISSATAFAQVTLTGQVSISGATQLTNTPPVPPSFFGMIVGTSADMPPLVPFGQFRFWDDGASWPLIEQTGPTPNFAPLDSFLLDLKTEGVNDVFYTLGRTPTWASIGKNDFTCDYPSQGPGSCDLPPDIDAFGNGTDQIWVNWVSAIATYVNTPTYLQNHAHIKYWEIWNEVYRSHVLSNYIPPNGNNCCYSFQGTYAQLVRLTTDARCVITGQGTILGAPCTPIDPTAQIVMPSSAANTNGALAVAQNFLYCNDNPKNGSNCSTGNQGANAVDIINYHLYVNQEPVEALLTSYVNGGGGLNGIRPSLQPAELAKPLWSGEDSWGVTNNNIGQFKDLDLQAAFVARYHMIAWSLGIASEFWYAYDNQAEGTLLLIPPPPQLPSLTPAGIAYKQVYNWMVGRSMTSPCSLTPPTGTIWNCALTAPGGYQALVVWDTSESCSNGTCVTHPYTVGAQYLQYRDLSGNVNQISGNSVPIGIKPILVENQQGGLRPESRRRP
jgi:hypothetical protein